jgi:hypothetical protein
MFCAACREPLGPLDQHCPRCGRPALGAQQQLPPAAYRVGRHLQTVGILWIVWAAWSLLGWLIALPFVVRVLGGSSPWAVSMSGPAFFGHDFSSHSMPWLATIITAVVLVRSVLAVITGIALLRRAPWARTLALVTAFLTLIKPITGTILAIYTLWVLLPGNSGREYQQMNVYR